MGHRRRIRLAIGMSRGQIIGGTDVVGSFGRVGRMSWEVVDIGIVAIVLVGCYWEQFELDSEEGE